VVLKDIDSLLQGFRQMVMAEGAFHYGSGETALAEGIPFPVRDLFLNSGLLFEWKLLAWYRSGGNSENLSDLLHRDLKGILNFLLNRIIAHHGKGSSSKKLDMLEQEARTLFDSITNRQISNVLNNREEGRNLYLELPFGDMSGVESARIRAQGRKSDSDDALDTESFSLTFDVMTSHIGLVLVTMLFHEQSVTLSCSLENEEFVEQAHTMSEDLVASLEARGFHVSAVTFDVSEKDTQNRGSGQTHPDVDVVG
jgi:hypothetical protein